MNTLSLQIELDKKCASYRKIVTYEHTLRHHQYFLTTNDLIGGGCCWYIKS